MTQMKDFILGMAVGDAFGVPYEFLSREEAGRLVTENMQAGAPITSLREHGRTTLHWLCVRQMPLPMDIAWIKWRRIL